MDSHIKKFLHASHILTLSVLESHTLHTLESSTAEYHIAESHITESSTIDSSPNKIATPQTPTQNLDSQSKPPTNKTTLQPTKPTIQSEPLSTNHPAIQPKLQPTIHSANQPITQPAEIYCASCFYAFDKKNLACIFKSQANSKHITLAAKAPIIAVAIASDTKIIRHIQGVQAKAYFSKASPAQERIYYQRFPFAKLGEGEVYALAIFWAKYTDNSLLSHQKLTFSRDLSFNIKQ